jgi:hypothetical protein
MTYEFGFVNLEVKKKDLPETADMPDYEFEDQKSEEVPGEDPLRRQEAEDERERREKDVRGWAEKTEEDDCFDSSKDWWPDD